MKILISKNGQQLGPYTIEAARALVLSGTIKANDWAWIDGATDWIPLNQVPSFANFQAHSPDVTAPSPKGAPIISNPPASFVCSTQEKEIWKGTPSQWLNLKVYVLWLLVFVGLFVVSEILKKYASTFPEIPQNIIGLSLAFLIPICLVHCAWRAIKLLATHYTVTNQRVRVVRGILSKTVDEIELFRVKDTSAHKSLFLRLFGLGNVTIVSGDSKNPTIFLRAIPRAFQLREQLRHEVFALRQRLGARELEIMQGN